MPYITTNHMMGFQESHFRKNYKPEKSVPFYYCEDPCLVPVPSTISSSIGYESPLILFSISKMDHQSIKIISTKPN